MDQKLLRYFSALRDETEAAQRGAAADISEVLSDVSRLCEDLLTDEEVSFALAAIFDPFTGIFDVVEKLLPNRNRSIQKGRENCLVFIADFMRRTSTRAAPYAPYVKERCISIFQRDDSKSVQAAALLPLISFLELCMQELACSNFSLDWSSANIFLQEYRKAKSSGTLRSNILTVLGLMVECFPAMFDEENIITILNLCLESLEEQLRQKGKDPLFVLVAGAMKCLDGVLMWFDRTLPAGGSVDASRRVYTYLEQVLYFREDLKRYEMVKAGLRLLSRHACLFRLRLLDDSMGLLKWLEAYCTHTNAQLRDAGLPAFNEFMLQISIGLSSDDRRVTNAQHVYKKLLAHALDILDARDRNFKLIALAIRMVGKLSPAILKFSGKEVLQQAFQRVAAFGSLSQREAQEESLGFSVTLVGAVSDIIDTLCDVDNYVVTVITEAVGNIFFQFPNLFPKQKLPVILTIQELFKTLERQGAIFTVFLNNIVWSSLERAMEPAKEDKEPRIELWKSYTELWSNLINFGSTMYHLKKQKEGRGGSGSRPNDGSRLQIQETIFDAMIVCVMKALRELNLKYRVKGATADKEISADGALNPDNDINPVEPLNDRDMKKFLNLVEFVQGFLSSQAVPYHAKWILPLVQCLVELSSCYPLLSGFYKLLTLIMRTADDKGYFTCNDDLIPANSDITANWQVGTNEREKNPYVDQESAVCKDLLSHYLQEVIISSKRYKLELLASCLRLCLSAPPLLMGLCSLIDPLKVALTMGLRYYPLADVAMDALDRWIMFSRCELESWLDTIVPLLNNYLSIKMAASTVEDEPLPTGNLENRSVLFRRIQNDRKDKMQPDPFQRLQLRILKFLGRIGKYAHSLVPDVNLLQIVGAGGLAWDTTEQLRFILPFRDDKTDAWLVSTIPQAAPSTHVVIPQDTKQTVEEPVGVLTRSQRAALGLKLPECPPSSSEVQTSTIHKKEALDQLKKELEELKSQQEAKAIIWCSLCRSPGHPPQDCPQRSYCHFCEKSGHEDKDCYYLKGLRQPQQNLAPSFQQGLPPASNMVSPYGQQSHLQPLLTSPPVQMQGTYPSHSFYQAPPNLSTQSFYTAPAVNPVSKQTRYPRPPPRPSNRPILCYRCGEYGHYQSKCALPEGSPPCCHCPEAKDHYSKDCPKQRASTSTASNQGQSDFTFPKINMISVSTTPQAAPSTHVVIPQDTKQTVEEPVGVLTRSQRAALGLKLPECPPSSSEVQTSTIHKKVQQFFFGKLGGGSEAFMLGTSKDHKWHVYAASAVADSTDGEPLYTVEMCMTRLDRDKAAHFYRSSCDSAKKMTKSTGISKLLSNLRSVILCLTRGGFTCFAGGCADVLQARSVLHCSSCKHASSSSKGNASSWESSFALRGYVCDGSTKQTLPGGSVVVFHTFRACSAGYTQQITPLPLLDGMQGRVLMDLEDMMAGVVKAEKQLKGFNKWPPSPPH
ncbi:hypothetical protein L7F22_058078 [Adiantum nelumboides]|nr:hypothetical protein [Adiantum nelumboides]